MKTIIEKITALRQQLHACPELAFEEYRTRETLKTFIERETGLEIKDRGNWFYVKARGMSDEVPIAIRADHDAVRGADDRPGHYCGHDGHSAVLAGAALYLAQHPPKRTVYMIFQPAEETGEGAKVCAEIIRSEGIGEIYGFHNIPGYAKGTVLLRRGTFACASTGLEIKLTGKPSHAAYPEAGINPAAEIARIILKTQELVNMPHEGMVLATVIGANIGSAAYGVSAHEGVLRMTLRGEYEREFDQLRSDVIAIAKESAQRCGAAIGIREIEPFSATENDARCVEKLLTAVRNAGQEYAFLDEPFRWSEDFGNYLCEIPGAMFGVGDGEDHPQLHTESFEFPDDIMENALRTIIQIANM